MVISLSDDFCPLITAHIANYCRARYSMNHISCDGSFTIYNAPAIYKSSIIYNPRFFSGGRRQLFNRKCALFIKTQINAVQNETIEKRSKSKMSDCARKECSNKKVEENKPALKLNFPSNSKGPGLYFNFLFFTEP